jgi:hypothetical protein
MLPFFSENAIAVTMKFTGMVYTSYPIMTLFFHKVSVILTPFCQR